MNKIERLPKVLRYIGILYHPSIYITTKLNWGISYKSNLDDKPLFSIVVGGFTEPISLNGCNKEYTNFGTGYAKSLDDAVNMAIKFIKNNFS